MSTNLDTLLSTGEFARLCHTTKDTLFHYEEIGILVPVFVKENGYRYYSAKQFFDFDLINVLKAADTPLLEIKHYLEHRTGDSFLDILKNKEASLERERLRIEQMQHRLKQAIHLTEYAIRQDKSMPRLVHSPEEYLVTVPLQTQKPTTKEVVSCLQEHLFYCSKKNLTEELPIGSIVLKETLMAGQCFESFYYSKIAAPIKSSRFLLKPEGEYAAILHHGYYNTLPASYAILFDYIGKNHLVICGNAYEYDLINYLATDKEENYIIEISIQVERLSS